MARDHMAPDEIDRLFEGQGPTRDPLDAALRRIRYGFASAPSPDVRTKHLAMMEAAYGAAPVVPPRRRRSHRRRVVIATSVASLLIGGSALAATGSLPGPAQDAVAKVAHGVGLNLPHSENPRSAENGGKQFSDAKKAWLDCERSGAADCGPKPNPQGFVHPTSEPAPGTGDGNDHGQGDSHRADHTPKPSFHAERTDNPNKGSGEVGGDHAPEPSETPNVDDNSGPGGPGDTGAAETPEPTETPQV